MNLQDEINKLTLMPSSIDTKVEFVPLTGQGRAEQDREINNRPVRLRNRNAQFYHEDEDNNYYDDDPVDNNQIIDMDYINSDVRKMNVCGNGHIEQYIQERQLKNERSKTEKLRMELESQERDDSTVSRLWKNGVIRGLVNQNIISKSDLVNNIPTNVENEIPEEEIKKNSSSNVNLVEDPNDPDLLLNPLLAHGKLSYDEEFILPRVGKKTTLTPRAYLKNMSDTEFEFKKKSK